MATYEQNLRNIRGEAIYGPDMRESIAEILGQTDTRISEKVTQCKSAVDNKIADLDSRINAVRVIVNNNLLYLNLEQMGGTNDYAVIIEGGTPYVPGM